MSDCSTVEIRELLPDYLNGTLSDARRNEVRAHVADCADCAEELELLQLVRQVCAETTPVVNVSAIVSSLPKGGRPARPAIRSWRRSHAFQIAAAASFIAIGGLSLAVARSFFYGNGGAVPADTVAVVTGETPISFAGGISDLGDEDLEALLSTLETIEALPVTEPSDPSLSGTARQGS